MSSCPLSERNKITQKHLFNISCLHHTCCGNDRTHLKIKISWNSFPGTVSYLRTTRVALSRTMIKYELLNDDNDNNNKKLHYFIFNIKWVYKSKYIIWLKYSLNTALGFQIVFNIHVKLEINHANELSTTHLFSSMTYKLCIKADISIFTFLKRTSFQKITRCWSLTDRLLIWVYTKDPHSLYSTIQNHRVLWNLTKTFPFPTQTNIMKEVVFILIV